MIDTKQADMFGGGDFEVAGKVPKAIQAVVDLYNEFAVIAGWRKSTVCDDGLQRAIRKRMKTYGGLVGWKTALERAAKSSFLGGKTGRQGQHEGWKTSLSFFMQEKSCRNLLEGVYDDPAGGIKAAVEKKTWNEERVAKAKAMLAKMN